jgi:hypothetical protein
MVEEATWFWDARGAAVCFLVGDDLFSRTGVHIGHRDGEQVFRLDGRYLGDLVGDRVLERAGEDRRIGATAAGAQPARTPPRDKPALGMLPRGYRALAIGRTVR